MNNGPRSNKRQGARRRNRVRIIGGELRGRIIELPDATDLRPTPDRVRETVFNWLMPVIPGSVCLDLFAGSGALGFEALSRGAKLVVMVEADKATAAHLQEQSDKLDCPGVQIVGQPALSFLRRPARAFDVVFLDPPFGHAILGKLCKLLEDGGWLSDAASISLEGPRNRPFEGLPDNWPLMHDKTAGQVRYGMARRRRS